MKERNNPLCDIRMKMLKLRGHVSQSSQTICMKVFVTHSCHIELNRSKNNSHDQPAKGYPTERSFRVPENEKFDKVLLMDRQRKSSLPCQLRHFDIMYGSIEIIVFGKNQEDNQQHVEMMRTAFIRGIEHLKNRQNLRIRGRD